MNIKTLIGDIDGDSLQTELADKHSFILRITLSFLAYLINRSLKDTNSNMFKLWLVLKRLQFAEADDDLFNLWYEDEVVDRILLAGKID